MVAVFTVYFEDPFWVGLLESEDESGLVVARHVFGAEPSNAELLDFMKYRFARMPRSRPLARGEDEAYPPALAGRNPKRAAREARREMGRRISTRSQAALAASLEAGKVERRSASSEERRAEAERKFLLRAEKRKRKREGH